MGLPTAGPPLSQKDFFNCLWDHRGRRRKQGYCAGSILQVYQRIGNFRSDASLSTWLHRITVNRCLNWKRRWTRRFKWMHVTVDSAEDETGNVPESDLPSPESRVTSAQTRQQIDNALKMLPDQARTVFVLREMEGLSYEAIADVVGIKLGTVRSRLFHARKRLREILQPLMEEGI
jgi:RNA polymerase sigma-70 factor (ECF subfamily)